MRAILRDKKRIAGSKGSAAFVIVSLIPSSTFGRASGVFSGRNGRDNIIGKGGNDQLRAGNCRDAIGEGNGNEKGTGSA